MAGYIGSKTSVTQVDGYNRTEADAEFVNDPNSVITVSGSNVGIGNSSPSSFPSAAKDLVIGNTTGSHGITIQSQNISNGNIYFTDTTTSASYNGFVRYYHGDNALAFGTNDGSERMRVDAAGRVTMPSQVGFSATDVSPHSQLGGGINITYTSVDHNVGNHYNSSTGVFTCPVDGKYLVLHTHLTYSNGDAFHLTKNGSVIRSSYVSGGDWQQPAICTIVDCAANDTLQMYAANVYLHTGKYGMFSIRLIG